MERFRIVWYALFLALSATATAQIGERPKGQPYFDTISLGFSRAVRAEAWVPVRVTLRNPGPSTDVEILTAAEESDGSRLPMLVRSRVHLAAGVTRKHVLYFRPERCERLIFELYQEGRLSNRESVEPVHLAPAEPLVVGLSYVGKGFVCDQVQGGGTRLRFNNSLMFEDLPSRWQGYEAVDVVVLGGLPPERLTVMQEQALADWVRAGGLLIVSPGGQPEHNIEGTLIEQILPVRILGTRLVEGLPPLEEIYGPIVRQKDRIGLSETVVTEGSVELQMGQLPLVVSRQEGLGRVVFVAFDLAADRLTMWPQLGRFYNDVIERSARLPVARLTGMGEEGARVLHENLGVRVLPRKVVAGFLGLNLVILLVLLLGVRGRRERAFMALVLCAPVMALIIYWAGERISNVTGPMAGAVHVVRSASGQSSAAGVGYHALLSDRETHCDVSFAANPTAFLRSFSAFGSADESRRTSAESILEKYEMIDGDVKSLRGLHLRPRSVTLFESSYMTDLGGAIEARAVWGQGGIRIEATNRSNRKIRDAFVACNRNALAIGDIAPGATVAATLTGDSAQGSMTAFSRAAFKTKQDAEEDRIVNSVYAVDYLNALADTGALVCGWFDDEPVEVKVTGLEPEPATRSRTLWAVAARREAESGRVLLPRGSMAAVFDPGRTNIFRRGRWLPVMGGSEMTVEFAAPSELRDLRPTRMTFFLRLGQAPAAVSIEAYNAEKKSYDIIAGEAGVLGPKPVALSRTAFALEPAERYWLPGRACARLRLVVQSLAKAESGGSRGPVIEELDMEVEGVRE